MRRLQEEIQKKETPTQDEESFLSLFQGVIRETSRNIPFNKDYAKLNELLYLEQYKNEIKEANTGEAAKQLHKLQALKKYFSDIFLKYQLDLLKKQQEEILSPSHNDDLLKSTDSLASLNEAQALKHAVSSPVKNKQTENDNDAEPETNTPTAWQMTMCERFSQSQKNKTPENFIEFLKAEGKKYLPENYAPAKGIVESTFPSSTENKIKNSFAHFQACKAKGAKKGAGLITSSAPQKSAALGRTDEDNQALQSFLSMLHAQKVSHVVVLGFNKNRLDYRNVDNDNEDGFESMQKNGSEIFYVIGNESSTGEIVITQFNVNDNASLNLTNEDCKKLIDIYAQYKSEMILVHCDSGVGRTGQIRLLFALLDYCCNNPSISQDISNLVASANAMQQSNALQSVLSASGLDDIALAQKEISCQIKDKIKQTLATLTTLMVETLFELRKMRYCLQTEDQFEGTPAQLLLLLATQSGCKPEILNAIRNCFDLKLPRDLSRSSTLSDLLVPDLQVTAATASENPLMPREHSSSSISSPQATPRTTPRTSPRIRPTLFTTNQGTQTDDVTISETNAANYG